MAAQTSTKSGKQLVIGEVKERFEKMTSVVFVDYKGMTVASATKLRANFKAAGVDYKVVKNTLVRQAIKGASYADSIGKSLVGMTGVAWSYEDPSSAAKVVKAFRKEEGAAGEKLTVKAGVVDGTILDSHAVLEQLALLPGKDELRGTLLATLQAPLQQFVALLQAPAQNLVYVLAAKEKNG